MDVHQLAQVVRLELADGLADGEGVDRHAELVLFLRQARILYVCVCIHIYIYIHICIRMYVYIYIYGGLQGRHIRVGAELLLRLGHECLVEDAEDPCCTCYSVT